MKELLKIILAIILPPLGTFIQVGLGKHFWINIILTLFGYIPGISARRVGHCKKEIRKPERTTL